MSRGSRCKDGRVAGPNAIWCSILFLVARLVPDRGRSVLRAVIRIILVGCIKPNSARRLVGVVNNGAVNNRVNIVGNE